MKIRKIAILLAAFCLLFISRGSASEYAENWDARLTDNEEIQEAKLAVLSAYWEKRSQREDELQSGAITIDNITMKLSTQIFGVPDELGYPLYIALHGGGAGDTPLINDEQWQEMVYYYSGSVTNGVYIATRGIRDTWNTHFNDESYSFYDRIIADAIQFYGVDPNRVYLLGFSAGGDGVYAIAPRMADRFAAVNMSSGHPNDISLVNMSCLPIFLQAGETDTAYNRHLYTAIYNNILDQLAENFNGGYPHETFIHVGMGHNYPDNGDKDQGVVKDLNQWLENGGQGGGVVYKDTNAIRLTSACVRNPLPNVLCWEIDVNAPQRKVTSFYWLGREGQLSKGTVFAGYDRESNSIAIYTDDMGDGVLKVYVNSDMLDIFSPVTLYINGEAEAVDLTLSYELMENTLEERGDPYYIFPAEIDIAFEGGNYFVTSNS